MDITSKELREVEFRERLRGYDTAEVDEFLERVAVAVDELHAQLRLANDKADQADQRARERPAGATDDEESLRRTLVLAQRTADMAIKEAQEAAAEILESARSEAGDALAQAEETARKLTNDAHQELQAEVERLTALRDQLRSDARTLSDLLDNERERLAGALNSALRWVDRGMSPSPALAAQRSAPLSSERADPADGVETQIQQDADAAAPAAPPSTESPSAESSSAASFEGAGGLAVDAEVEAGYASPEALPPDIRQGLGIVRDEPGQLALTPTALGSTSDPLQETQSRRHMSRRGQDAGWPA